jgi:hypothetical protein
MWLERRFLLASAGEGDESVVTGVGVACDVWNLPCGLCGFAHRTGIAIRRSDESGDETFSFGLPTPYRLALLTGTGPCQNGKHRFMSR